MTDQVFPVMFASEYTEDATPEYPRVVCEFKPIGGLPKREFFAALAMQGFISANLQGIPMTGEELARRSVGCANALLAELAK